MAQVQVIHQAAAAERVLLPKTKRDRKQNHVTSSPTTFKVPKKTSRTLGMSKTKRIAAAAASEDEDEEEIDKSLTILANDVEEKLDVSDGEEEEHVSESEEEKEEEEQSTEEAEEQDNRETDAENQDEPFALETTEDGRFKCPHCPLDYAGVYGVKRHVERKHPDEEFIDFKAIQSTQGTQRTTAQRPKRQSGFDCDWPGCERTVKTKSSLLRHVNRVHRGLKPHPCP